MNSADLLTFIFGFINSDSLDRILKITSALWVFLGLLVVRAIVLKILSWISPYAEMVGKKIRFQVFGFIISFSLWWFLLDLPEFPFQAQLVRFTSSFILFFLALLLFDFLNQLFFGIYSARLFSLRVPRIVTNLIRVIYFIGIVLVILHNQHRIDIRPFLTGSAIVTAIIGLALQDTLGNLFSGLALHISRPFDVGHWIKYGEVEGTAVLIDWRSTTIKTRDEDFITIPNSQLAKEDVINFSTPTTVHGQVVYVGVRYEYPPNKIKKLLAESALSAKGVVKEIKPQIFLTKYNDFSIDYMMRFFVDDYQAAPDINSAVMERMWYLFKRNNVEIPFPIRDVYMKKEEVKEESSENLVALLSKVDFLQNLNKGELQDVSKLLKHVLFAAGEYIIQQGEKGDSFYIIKSGQVRVTATNPYGDVFLDKELKTGNFFGEISVLTGEPRTANVQAITDTKLLMLDKSDFENILKKYPNTDAKICEKIAERQKNSFEKMELSRKSAISEKEAREKAQKRVESLSQQLLAKIRNFFSLR